MSLAGLAQPPESFRPDRLEIINQTGTHAAAELAPGALFDCLIGRHNHARNLTTGLLTMDPRAQLPSYRVPVSSSITLLAGSAIVTVEGREYVLDRLDNITIPRTLPHAIHNVSNNEAAQLHMAYAGESPRRERVSTAFKPCLMPNDCPGIPGKEYVTRFTTAARSEAGPGTSFIDHFNQDLMPGIEMSGGYGWFEKGGRLPAHFHDFDESICIIQGTATCIVEGRRYEMSDCATALQPRGRVHYFINEREEPMEMLWVYAGPLPERIVTDEHYATAEGSPWN